MTLASDVLLIATNILPSTFSQTALLAALNAGLNDAGKTETSLDIAALADTARYAITIPPEQIIRVDIIAAGSTTPAEFYWWRAFGGYLNIDAHPPGAGDTLRVYYYDRVTPLAIGGTVPPDIDPQRLAWLTVYYACIARMQITANTDPNIKELFQTASQMRNEFMARRASRNRARAPHYSNW